MVPGVTIGGGSARFFSLNFTSHAGCGVVGGGVVWAILEQSLFLAELPECSVSSPAIFSENLPQQRVPVDAKLKKQARGWRRDALPTTYRAWLEHLSLWWKKINYATRATSATDS